MLKSILSFSLVLIMSLTCISPVSGQEIPQDSLYEVYRLPKGALLPYENQKYMCYDLEQFKMLLHMDNDFRSAVESLSVTKSKVYDLSNANLAFKKALSISDQQIELMRAENKRLSILWTEENRLRHIAENKPSFGGWVPWSLTGVLGVLSVGLIVGIVASN